jgi:hypothetical protein
MIVSFRGILFFAPVLNQLPFNLSVLVGGEEKWSSSRSSRDKPYFFSPVSLTFNKPLFIHNIPGIKQRKDRKK